MYSHQIEILPEQYLRFIYPEGKPAERSRFLRGRFRESIAINPVGLANLCAKGAFLQRAISIVEENLADEAFDVGQLAKEIGLCRRQLHRKMRRFVNLSPVRFIATLRLQRAAVLIRHSKETIAEIAYQTGFNTPNYFCKVFRKEFGCTPREYRESQQVTSDLKLQVI